MLRSMVKIIESAWDNNGINLETEYGSEEKLKEVMHLLVL